MKRFISMLLVTVLFALCGVYVYMEERNKEKTASATIMGGNLSAKEEFKPKVNALTYSINLPDLNDKQIVFGDKQDKLQLVNFWASWCGPCIMEAPDLVKLHENYSEQITLYAVNSTYYDKEREARAFVEQFGFKFDVLFDRDGDITDLYKVNTYPTSFIIDREGIIRERINGVIPFEEWERLIDKWL